LIRTTAVGEGQQRERDANEDDVREHGDETPPTTP